MRILTILMTATLIAGQSALAEDIHHHHATLSREDVEELLRGGGWGLAKAAELNGLPGPTHVLDMAADLGLSDEQVKKIDIIRDEMLREAKALGERFAGKEAELEHLFQSGDVSEPELAAKVEEIQKVRARLRTAHLAAHVRVARILTVEQTEHYAVLRGYR